MEFHAEFVGPIIIFGLRPGFFGKGQLTAIGAIPFAIDRATGAGKDKFVALVLLRQL